MINLLSNQYTTKCCMFNELSLNELYAILALRQEVFIVEQNCPFLDADGKDFVARHLMLFDSAGELVAYTRLFGLHEEYEGYLCIGRVVSSPKARGKGLGKYLMETSIQQIRAIYGNYPIKIGSQVYLDKFYESLGFCRISDDTYLEDGIEHRYMVLK